MVQERPVRVERRLSAILAADVAGYSRLMHHDEEATHARLTSLLTEAVHPAIGEAEIILTRSLKQFRLDKIEVCCGLQKLVRAMMLQGCRTADRAEVVESGRFATPNSLKSHGERNLLSPFSNPCAITPKLCMLSRSNTPFEKLPALKSTYRG